ncbi:NUMOD4 domain-containing protein [Exiguobacterium indicum]|uniref:NUMOD4 domain-containing protein n=1 Tax=Exiguobacterium indicum TaxID=296995 RepID=UPI000737698F|nr:NUMOD4 domain-containing protein [Exiguobacterium indicum]
MENEVWKKVEGYSNYEFSSLGRARSLDRVLANGKKLKGKILKQTPGKHGYYQTSFVDDEGNKKSLLLHRMIAKAFFSNFTEGKVVTRIDGDTNNLRIDNLRIDDPATNAKHNIEIGFRYDRVGSKINQITYAKEFYIRKLLSKEMMVKEISEMLDVSVNVVSKIKNGFYDQSYEKRKKYALISIALYKEYLQTESNFSDLAKKCGKRTDWVKYRIDHGKRIAEELQSIASFIW